MIAGGGLSGLSLVAHLVAAGHRGPVVVVDNETRPVETRTWASWTDRAGLLDAAVCRRYHRIRIHAGGQSRVVDLGRYWYQAVRGADLRETVRRLTVAAPQVEFRYGQVDRVELDGVVVDGHHVPARWVFDSVSGRDRPSPVDAWLDFRGWRVHSERPAFDPEVPTFFDFRTQRLGGASFAYVLPFDAHHALVEHTSFVPPDTPITPLAQRDALADYLTEVVDVGDYAVTGEESGRLPLRPGGVPRRHGDVLAIGAGAGLVKGSTGYAYQRIQRDSAAIARSLSRHGHPFDLPEPLARHRLFDGALLDVVARNPAQLERVFNVIFRYRTAEPALRFLDESTTVGQECRLFAGMPTATFAAAVVRQKVSAVG